MIIVHVNQLPIVPQRLPHTTHPVTITTTVDAQQLHGRQRVPCGEQGNNENRGEVRRTSVVSPISREAILITFDMVHPITILTILTTFKASSLLNHYGCRKEKCVEARAHTHAHTQYRLTCIEQLIN